MPHTLAEKMLLAHVEAGDVSPGESAVSNTNRNFKGRMGSGDASVHLANAYVAAAAAVAGEIVDPADVLEEAPA